MMTREELNALSIENLKTAFAAATGAHPVALNRNQMIKQILAAPPQPPVGADEPTPALPAWVPMIEQALADAAAAAGAGNPPPAADPLSIEWGQPEPHAHVSVNPDGRSSVKLVMPPVGTRLTHQIRGGANLVAEIVDTPDGVRVRVDGVDYKTLSGAAKAKTNQVWNGGIFWGLTPYPKPRPKPAAPAAGGQP